MTEDRVQNQFDLIAQYYDLLYADRIDDLAMVLALSEAIQGSILEVGCGTGRLLLPLVQNDHHVTGLDISEIALDAVQNKLKAGGYQKQASLYQADMRSFDLPKKDFSLAFLPINTFMHCLTQTDQLATLSAIYNHLLPGGQLVIDLYHPHPQALLEGDGRIQFVEQRLDDLTGHMIQWFSIRQTDIGEQLQEVTYLLDEIAPEGTIRRQSLNFTMRYIHRFEMSLLLNQVGFSIDELYGDYDFSSFYHESPRMIFVATK